MRLSASDFIHACVVGAGLIAVAFFACVALPHGFEGGIGWGLILLPGLAVAALISDPISRLTPIVGSIVYWFLLFFLNFGLYTGISFLTIKAYRLSSKLSK